MKAEVGDIFLQTAEAGHAGIIVETNFGLSLGHAATTGLKATPLDDKPVHIFRCNDRDLAGEAAQQAKHWCQKLIQVNGKNPEYLPFASKERELQVSRLQGERNLIGKQEQAKVFDNLTAQPTGFARLFGPRAMSANEAMPQAEIGGIKAILEKQDREFTTYGRFRAIKYAARRALTVAHIEYDNSTEKGYKVGPTTTCAMFTVVCFQVAGLAPYVTAASSFNGDDWVSNKHGAVLDVDPKDHVKMGNYFLYLEYLKNEYGEKHIKETESHDMKLRLTTPTSPRTGKQFRSALSMWTGGSIDTFDFRGKLTEAMCVDAKRCRAPELLARCARDKDRWKYLGFFTFEGTGGDLKNAEFDPMTAALDPRKY